MVEIVWANLKSIHSNRCAERWAMLECIFERSVDKPNASMSYWVLHGESYCHTLKTCCVFAVFFTKRKLELQSLVKLYFTDVSSQNYSQAMLECNF